ncbi:hypothetical protein KP509_01G037100 [Ceratopteris richardii]|uniref:Uncharacterized protein n=1 Tax=Ceratopteris richardii TaxID=49495 RepID=A0A8T2VJV9_CERRI|nr:hypothetical protein KP509_01G037100 [Ceratopteris richardii]
MSAERKISLTSGAALTLALLLLATENCMHELLLERALCSTPSTNLATKEIMSKKR